MLDPACSGAWSWVEPFESSLSQCTHLSANIKIGYSLLVVLASVGYGNAAYSPPLTPTCRVAVTSLGGGYKGCWGWRQEECVDSTAVSRAQRPHDIIYPSCFSEWWHLINVTLLLAKLASRQYMLYDIQTLFNKRLLTRPQESRRPLHRYISGHHRPDPDQHG